MKYNFILFLVLISSILKASTFDSTLSKDINSATFLKTFDYSSYINTIEMDNLKALEEDRQALLKLNIDGDEFIWTMFEQYIKQTTLDFEEQSGNIKELLRLGEVMVHSTNYLPDSIYIYTAVSDLIFETVAQSLEKSIASKELNKHDFYIRYLVNRLCDNQYCISIRSTTTEKVLYNINQGNWLYLWNKGTSTYLKEFLMLLSGVVVVIGLVFWSSIRLYRKRSVKAVTNN